MFHFVQHDNYLNEQALKHPVVLNEVKHLAEMTMILVGKASEFAVMLNEVKQLTELPRERHTVGSEFWLSMTGLTRWGFGGGKPPPKISFFRLCGATKSPHTGEKKGSWRVCDPPNLPLQRRLRKSCE